MHPIRPNQDLSTLSDEHLHNQRQALEISYQLAIKADKTFAEVKEIKFQIKALTKEIENRKKSS